MPERSVIDFVRVKSNTVRFKCFSIGVDTGLGEISFAKSGEMIDVPAAVFFDQMTDEVDEGFRLVGDDVEIALVVSRDIDDRDRGFAQTVVEVLDGIRPVRQIDADDAVEIVEVGKFKSGDIAFIVVVVLFIDAIAEVVAEGNEEKDLDAELESCLADAFLYRMRHRFVDIR